MGSGLRVVVVLLVGLGACSSVDRHARNLRNEDQEIRRKASAALLEMGPDAADAVPALARALRDPDYGVRWNAATALGRIGAKAAPAVPELVRGLGDEVRGVRQSCLWALRKIGKAGVLAAIPALAGMLRSSDAGMRWSAAESLGKVGPAAAPTLPDLRRLAATDPDDAVRAAAAAAVQRLESGR
jgi:HEAT repeat protein